MSEARGRVAVRFATEEDCALILDFIRELALYEKNRLTVVRQLLFKVSSSKALDLALCVNGIPVVTAELKNPMTGLPPGAPPGATPAAPTGKTAPAVATKDIGGKSDEQLSEAEDVLRGLARFAPHGSG